MTITVFTNCQEKMSAEKSLADFRANWIRELAQCDAKSVGPTGSEIRGQLPDVIKRSNPNLQAENDATAACGKVVVDHRHVIEIVSKNKRKLDDSWDGSHEAKRKSNTLKPFIIAENLLRESTTGDASQTTVKSHAQAVQGDNRELTRSQFQRQDIRRSTIENDQFHNNLTCIKCGKLLKPAKPKLTHSCLQTLEITETKYKSFVDVFIADLNEITDIPFFDLEVPREVAINIFKHLDLKDLCHCAQVSKAWRSLSEDEFLWYGISSKLGFHHDVHTVDRQNWKQFVTQCVLTDHTLQYNWKNHVLEPRELVYEMGGVICAATSHQNLVAVGYNSGEVKLWDLHEMDGWTLHPSSTALVLDEQYDYGTVPNYVTCLAINGRHTMAGYSQGFVDVWANEGSKSAVHTLRCSSAVSAICTSHSDPLFAVANGNQLQLIKADTTDDDWSELNSVVFDQQISNIRLLSGTAREHHYVAVVALYDQVKVHFPGDHGELSVYHAINHPVSCIDARSSELAVAMSSYDDLNDVYKVKMYALTTGQEKGSYTGHHWTVTALNLADSPPDMFVTGCADKKVRVYDCRVPEAVSTLSGHTSAICSVQMDDGQKVVSGSSDGLLCVWDVRCAAPLWDVHNRHALSYLHFDKEHLITANIPTCHFPIMDDTNERMVHRRYRGSLCTYNFNVSSEAKNIPGICQSNYTDLEAYNYNIRLAVPYDQL